MSLSHKGTENHEEIWRYHEETHPLPVDRDRCDSRTCVWSHIVDTSVSQDCFLFSILDCLLYGDTHDRFWRISFWDSGRKKHLKVRLFVTRKLFHLIFTVSDEAKSDALP
jgi:hypothetical protein